MIDTYYENRMLYYNMMKDFLSKKITPWRFRKKYCNQRNHDINENRKNRDDYYIQKNIDIDEAVKDGFAEYYQQRVFTENEKIFKEKYFSFLYEKFSPLSPEYDGPLYEKGSKFLPKYERALKDFDIKGEIFFMHMQELIEMDIIDYYPKYKEGFNPGFDTDEKTLRRVVQLAFDVLERHKDRWM